jgi:hypothetical protein
MNQRRISSHRTRALRTAGVSLFSSSTTKTKKREEKSFGFFRIVGLTKEEWEKRKREMLIMKLEQQK